MNLTHVVILVLQATDALNQEAAEDYCLPHNSYTALRWMKWKVICKSEERRVKDNNKKQMVGLKHVATFMLTMANTFLKKNTVLPYIVKCSRQTHGSQRYSCCNPLNL